MRKLALNLGERSYDIYIEQGLISNGALIEKFCSGDKVLIVSNKTIAPLYIEKLKQSLTNKNVYQFLLPDGEVFKSLESFSAVIDYLISCGFRRNDTLIALGGGVVGDLGGFVAASYQRGMGFIQLPTTLLAQVDSSVGGKTAVNHPLGKNMIGAFYQPKAVFIDTDTLSSLPEKEYYSGFAEIVKYAILGSLPIKECLLSKMPEIKKRDQNILTEIIYYSCEKKATVVSEDEKEKGSRALLNLGHTFGHAIERLTEYKKYLHGEAVSIGMLMAMNLSVAKGLLSSDVAKQYRKLILALGLPDKVTTPMSVDDILVTMKLDKKNLNEKYRLIIPKNDHCILVEEDELELIKQAIVQQLG